MTVQNMTESIYDSTDPLGSRIACKFTISESAFKSMKVDQFEDAMCMELVMAIRKIKKEMIMKGIEP